MKKNVDALTVSLADIFCKFSAIHEGFGDIINAGEGCLSQYETAWVIILIELGEIPFPTKEGLPIHVDICINSCIIAFVSEILK